MMLSVAEKISTIRSEARLLAFKSYCRSGHVPVDLAKINGFAAELEELIKYNPNWAQQPRVPAGNPRGGQWTRVSETSFAEGNDDQALKPIYPELLLLPFLSAPRLISAIRNFIVSRRRGADWQLGSFKSAKRWANQMQSRNWTPNEITRAIRFGERFKAPNKVNPLNTATRYQDKKTGRYVVQDDTTKEILQLSGDNFDPNKLD